MQHADGSGDGGADRTGNPCAAEVLAGEGNRPLRDARRREEERGDAELAIRRVISTAQDECGEAHAERGDGTAHAEHAVRSENSLGHECQGKCCGRFAACTAEVCGRQEADADAERHRTGAVQLIHDLNHELYEGVQRNGQKIDVEQAQNERCKERNEEGRHHGLENFRNGELLQPADEVAHEKAEEQRAEKSRCNVRFAHGCVGGVAEDEAGGNRRLAADGVGDVGTQHRHHH